MKHNSIKTTIATLVAAIGMANLTPAQAADLKGKIPFDFYVGNQKFTAGTVVATKPNDVTIALRKMDSSERAIVLVNAVESNAKHVSAKLVFRRVGQHYFLAEVWTGDSNRGRQTMPSRTERTLRKEAHMAANMTLETIEVSLAAE